MPENSAPFEGSDDQHADNAAHDGEFEPVFRIFFKLWLHRSVRLRIKRALNPSVRLSIAVHNIVAHHQVIDLAIDEAAISVIGRANDRLPAHVEGSIDQRRATGGLLESLQQGVELRVLLATQRLDSR